MRVFVSSTVFDLIDVRAEVASQLRSMGIVPVMSDDKLSDFRVEPHEDSIETCLVNLDSCDEVILILDRRYGPKLGRAGFEDVSATHLEYRRAVERKKPIHVFVRDRTEAEHGIWKKNKKAPVALIWVQENDFGIFGILDEHKRLQAQSKKSNWCDTFTSSIDLKAAIAKRFEGRTLPQRLVDAIQRNEFPIISVSAVALESKDRRDRMNQYALRIQNVGGAPAFKFEACWDKTGDPYHSQQILAPGEHCLIMTGQGSNDYCSCLSLRYSGVIGVEVHDEYSIICQFDELGQIITFDQLMIERNSQKFVLATRFQIEIVGLDVSVEE